MTDAQALTLVRAAHTAIYLAMPAIHTPPYLIPTFPARPTRPDRRPGLYLQ